MSQRSRRLTGAALGAMTISLLASCSLVSVPDRAAEKDDARNSTAVSAASTSLGAFLGSDEEGVRRMPDLQDWLGGTDIGVGHTYLPGDRWASIEGHPDFLRPWADWRGEDEDRLFVLNVPMMERNEEGVSDDDVRDLLQYAADGDFDHHFRRLAENLVEQGLSDTVITLGWEMNGVTYTHRCGPDPEAWKEYWNRIVAAMRSVEGEDFRFDFTPNRGRDAIGWTKCYPGDDVVDIIGMDSYDQPTGMTFDEMIEEPYGLQDQVDFADEHDKEISYPEWGLFRNGDNDEFVRRMLEWIDEHKPLYQTITDYCPHGVWQCEENPRSSRAYRSALYDLPEPAPSPARPPVPGRRENCFPLDLGESIERWFGTRRLCIRIDLLERLLGKAD
ncbi:glycoside hydrolase family 26 protein [Streptomyces sp. NPDC048248]|uniref:glycoside hydrolase family 26 protein n=1 Tax=Streptomyces sp. NPDC048248 TaxID=3365523 RepID=UPI00371E7D6C